MLTFLWTGMIITFIILSSLLTGCFASFYMRSKNVHRAISALKYWVTNPLCDKHEVQIILGIAE